MMTSSSSAGQPPQVQLSFRAENLLNMDHLTKSDPFLVLYSVFDDDLTKVVQTPVMMKTPASTSSSPATTIDVSNNNSSIDNNTTKINQKRFIGKTEKIANTLNPSWLTTFTVDYFFQKKQVFLAELYDDDGASEEPDPLGCTVFTLSDVITNNMKGGGLKVFKIEPQGRLVVSSALLASVGHDTIQLTFRGENLKNMDTFSYSDPYFILKRIYYSNNTQQQALLASSSNVAEKGDVSIYRSEVIDNNLDPQWQSTPEIPLSCLTLTREEVQHTTTAASSSSSVTSSNFPLNNNNSSPIPILRLEVFDKDLMFDDQMGFCHLTFEDLLKAEVSEEAADAQQHQSSSSSHIHKKNKESGPFKLLDNQGNFYGKIYLTQTVIRHKPTFFEHLQNGLHLNLSIAIDFTASNGNPLQSSSLHYLGAPGFTDRYLSLISEDENDENNNDENKNSNKKNKNKNKKNGTTSDEATRKSSNKKKEAQRMLQDIVKLNPYLTALKSVADVVIPYSFSPEDDDGTDDTSSDNDDGAKKDKKHQKLSMSKMKKKNPIVTNKIKITLSSATLDIDLTSSEEVSQASIDSDLADLLSDSDSDDSNDSDDSDNNNDASDDYFNSIMNKKEIALYGFGAMLLNRTISHNFNLNLMKDNGNNHTTGSFRKSASSNIINNNASSSFRRNSSSSTTTTNPSAAVPIKNQHHTSSTNSLIKSAAAAPPPSPYVKGIHAVVKTYLQCLNEVSLAGPTNFAPIINSVAALSRSKLRQAQEEQRRRFRRGGGGRTNSNNINQDPSSFVSPVGSSVMFSPTAARSTSGGAGGMMMTKQSIPYTILLMITDGDISDMEKTIDAIVNADDAPISIIIVGVGSCDFSLMEELDGDVQGYHQQQNQSEIVRKTAKSGMLLVDNEDIMGQKRRPKQKSILETSTGRVARRDLVQFVPYRDFFSNKNNNDNDDSSVAQQMFAAEVLREIPCQVEDWAKLQKEKKKSR